MSFLDKLTHFLSFGKKEEVLEYFFALNISSEKLTAALWTIEGRELKILETASDTYSSLEDLGKVTDKLLDQSLGIKQIEVSKILFGVPSTWLSDENLKDEYLKILRGLVKELELTPMAYVEGANAVVHLLEKQEGIPPTAVLVGFEDKHLIVTIVRAGKLDGVKIISRGDNSGTDIEKALLTFTAVETLPSKILIYGTDVSSLKSQLLSFPWMSKLSFLHFPKIDILPEDVEIKSICLAGASEINPNVLYKENKISEPVKKGSLLGGDQIDQMKSEAGDTLDQKEEDSETSDDLGFVVGDVAEIKRESNESKELEESEVKKEDVGEETELVVPEDSSLAEIEDFDQELAPPPPEVEQTDRRKFHFKLPFKLSKRFTNFPILFGIIGTLLIILLAYLILPKAEVKIFVEPKILEKDAQVVADPSQKEVNEDKKIIPGQIVDSEVSGTAKDTATGKKQIGDPSKGTIVVYNKTLESKSLSKGTQISGSSGIKFTLDTSVNIASQSATDSGVTFGKTNTTVTAAGVGADGNLPSGSEFTVSGYSTNQLAAKAEGNFSGGTSKEVTVVSDADQKRLLASLASDLKRQAKQKLQERLPQKKILEEALSEEIVKKAFSKNINDQTSEFSLNLTAKYKGTAFEDKDLKLIVSKLVTTDVPGGFELNLEDTETQADVSKLEKDGKLIFLARFKAKLMPKIDISQVKNKIKGKSVREVINILKGMENILGSEIKISPSLPLILQRIPLLDRNIQIQVGLK